ncbi:MAG: hypothetical protein V2A73_12650 [Pseudomonadota bacterium]
MAGADRRHNLLVLSDLHLGEDLRPATKTGYLRHLLILERELEAFLDYYGSRRMDDRPWRLIVNGDMVDFLSVCLIPGDNEAIPPDMAGIDPEEAVYGLGTKPLAVCHKMRRVLERHPKVFRALARFLGKGNSLAIIAGNHDVEFHWPVVQETFRRGIAALWIAESDKPGDSGGQRSLGEPDEQGDLGEPGEPGEIERAISFHPWFYFEENVAWIEHGHQYDDYCSFDYVLDPVAPKKQEIVLSISAACYRYVLNQAQSYCSSQEDWSGWKYLRWAVAQGYRTVLQLAKAYSLMVFRLLGLWRSLVRPEDSETRRRTHEERLRSLAAQFKLGEDVLLALDSLRRQPVVKNLTRLALAIMLDRFLLVVAAALLVLVWIIALPFGRAMMSALVTVIVVWIAGSLLARARCPVDPSPKLETIPRLIRQLVHAPFVVFGHSHCPIAHPLPDGGWYFNTGTWVAGDRQDILAAFTHLLIRQGERGPEAVLCQWRDGQSRTYVPLH